MSKYFFSFPSNMTTLKISDFVFEALIDTIDTDEMEKHRLKVVVSELFVNAFKHGNNSDPSKYIDVIFDIDKRNFEVVVKDQGSGLARETFRAFVDSWADPEEEHGRGIKIVCKLSDNVNIFKDSDGKFCVRAVKNIKDKVNNFSLVINK